jgi:PAS domain S-box-containing protein
VSDSQTDFTRLGELTAGLGLRQHLCMIYDTQEEEFAAALPYLRTGLERGEKCLYIVDENTAAAVLDALRKGGTDVDRYLRSDALTIVDKNEAYVKTGRFGPDSRIRFWTEAATEARAANFSGLRALADMTWAFGARESVKEFIEFESKLNHLVRDHDVVIVCQYNRARVPPEIILGILRTHPLVVYGGIVCKNPYYVPPDEFLKPTQASREVERLLNNILTWEQAQQALRHSEERLRRVIDTVPALIHTARPDGYLDFFNQRWLDYVGLPLEELLDWRWTAAIHPEDVAAMVEKWRASVATGEPCEHEARVRRADGQYRWMVHRDVPLRDDRGKIVKWYASSIDIEDRKQAEEGLRRSEQLYSKLVNSVDCIVFEADAKTFQFRFVSPQAKRIRGYPPEQWLSPNFWVEHLHADDRAWWTALRKQATEEGQDHALEYRMAAADGQTVWLRDVVSVQTGPDGPSLLTGVMIDVTRRKLAEIAAKESGERFRLVFERSTAGMLIGDASGEIIRANKSFCDIVGYSEDELRGRSIIDITHPEDAVKTVAYLREAQQHRAPSYDLEKRYVRKNGEVVWGRASAVFLLPEGRPACWVVVVLDITERKRAEEALRESEERFRTIFENAGVGTALVDRQGHPIKCNPALQRMLGYTEEELRGMVFTDFTHPDDRDLDWALYSELAAGKRDRYEIEKRYIKKDGQPMWGHLTASLVRTESGAPDDYTIGMVEDITDRRLAEEALQKSRDQLRALAARAQTVREEERTRVAREIHDELGQALTAIKIDLSSLCRELPADKRQQSKSILKLVDETIQSVRRISTELRPAVLDAVGLVAAVEWAVGEFETRTGTTYQLDLPKEDIAIDQDRATALFRIFQETLTNVARHAGATEVSVRLAKDDSNLTLVVHDNGKGLSEEQLSATNSLGILGMRERALLLGGELAITGAPGEGTTVKVRIPETYLTTPKGSK